jgi:hypothetical protein
MAYAVREEARKSGAYPVIAFQRPAAPTTLTDAASAYDEWPRFMQVAGICLVFLAAILAGSHVLSAGAGLAIGFLALAMFFFGSYAAHRRGNVPSLLGRTVSLLGLYGSLIVLLAVCINLV